MSNRPGESGAAIEWIDALKIRNCSLLGVQAISPGVTGGRSVVGDGRIGGFGNAPGETDAGKRALHGYFEVHRDLFEGNNSQLVESGAWSAVCHIQIEWIGARLEQFGFQLEELEFHFARKSAGPVDPHKHDIATAELGSCVGAWRIQLEMSELQIATRSSETLWKGFRNEVLDIRAGGQCFRSKDLGIFVEVRSGQS